MMIVNTSPFLKGRSCSDVPLKLYLATHSVPCGHGAFGKMDRSQISREIHFKSLLTRHALNCDLWVFMNVCSLQIFHRPGHLSWWRVSVLSPQPFSNWNHQSWQTHTCRRCKMRANFNICVSSNRKTVDVQHCSAEDMQIYSKLNQLLSHWEVSAQAAPVKITLRHKKAEVTPLASFKKKHTFTSGTERFHDVEIKHTQILRIYQSQEPVLVWI